MDLVQEYNNLVNSRVLERDYHQYEAIGKLEIVRRDLSKYKKIKSIPHLFFRMLKPIYLTRTKLKKSGIYFHGGVGTGKSMLMDLFYKNAGIVQKKGFIFTNLCMNFIGK